MPTVRIIRRLNPGRRRLSRKRTRMTPRQIRFFGSRRQKAALKAARHRRRTPVAAHRPSHRSRATAHRHHVSHRIRRKVNRRRASKRNKVLRRRRNNPALIVTLGALNPRRRRKSTMARRRRKSSRRNHPVARRRRRRNQTRVVVVSRRRQNRGHRHRRRNPSLFGSTVSASEMGQAILGGLVGVTAAKLIPPALPASLISSPAMRVVVTGASAFAAGWLGGRFNARFGDAVLFGGLMQTGSVLLNAFLPSLGRQIGLSGMGELVDARFSVPQNPLRFPAPAPMPAQARVTMSGLARAFSPAF